MHRIARTLTAVAVSAAAVTAVASSAALATTPGADTPQSFRVDSRSILSTPSTHSLRSGEYYFATISGVVSYYGQSVWATPKAGRAICGTTAPITTPSHGEGPGVGGADAEMLFAGTAKRGCGTPKPPYAWGNFQVSTNGFTYANLDPVGGKPSVPAANHAYTYVVQGHGTDARFKFNDVRYSDNDGSLKVDIRHATSADCKNNGWKAFGAFHSQQDCQVHV
jgi:hypothetical protein